MRQVFIENESVTYDVYTNQKKIKKGWLRKTFYEMYI